MPQARLEHGEHRGVGDYHGDAARARTGILGRDQLPENPLHPKG